MGRFHFIFKTVIHYFKGNLLIALGVAISTMVLTGSLIIGDSMRYSLKQAAWHRLGNTTHLVSANERYFRIELSSDLYNEDHKTKVAPVLLLEGMAVSHGGEQRINKAQVIGVDSSFNYFARADIYEELQSDVVFISRNLAEKLHVNEGDFIMLRIRKASAIPLNAPFVSDEETSIAIRVKIGKIVELNELARFNLKVSQTAPYNVFISIKRLNELMELDNKANQLLISTETGIGQVKQLVENNLKPEDAGLKLRSIESTGEIEVSTERVFLEDQVAVFLQKLPQASPLLTYFVNSIESGVKGKVPYSFVSTLPDSMLAENEVILNQWTAEELNVQEGDTVNIGYFQIGPLRRLLNAERKFVVSEIVPMEFPWADSSRMPYLPGLSDAGHCREWEAGVPIDLDAIRQKDEDYWNRWKGTPKAFISLGEAKKLWSSRFGSFTAVRYPAVNFNLEEYHQLFAQEIHPADIGIAINPVMEQGIDAAENGTDFSGLFIGLSFFLLASAVILTVLLFRLNLETRSDEAGILMALGFGKNKIRNLFLYEGLIVAFTGAIIGILLSVFYTRIIFNILNGLWNDIVRTDMLLIQINQITLATGFLISMFISAAAIYVIIKKYQKQQAAELQKKVALPASSVWNRLANGFMFLSLLTSGFILINQIIASGELNTSLFFVSGLLLLVGLLLLFRIMIIKINFRKFTRNPALPLSFLNIARNQGRSMTVAALFAIGTFLVVSTGSNKMDLLTNANDKSGGTGGFNYFAETTIPVLFDINDPEKKKEEGIYEDFKAVQFHQVKGDDASCLNLNRISQPAVLGVDPHDLADRFGFATKLTDLNGKDPWLTLDHKPEDGWIPAIADQTVIQWGLGKKIGDVLFYQNEKGDTIGLKLIAGTLPSVFQGYIIISNDHFIENYPSVSGSSVFLIDPLKDNQQEVGDALHSVFRDYGWEMQSTAERLAGFYSVTNTYLSIFLALGALGLLLGTVGLAVVLARSLLERQSEIALMQALGFGIPRIFYIVTSEYALLLTAGILTGFIAAVIAVFPALSSVNTDISSGMISLLVIVILLNGLFWIMGLTWISLHKRKLTEGLRLE